MVIKAKSILLVDDNPDDIFLTRRAILDVRPDCIVEEAGDGSQALERLRNLPSPGLILLDLKMPGIDGFEVLDFIRKLEHSRFVPVVILSSSILVNDIKSAYSAGANGFLHKLPDFSEFTECLKTCLHYWIDFNCCPV